MALVPTRTADEAIRDFLNSPAHRNPAPASLYYLTPCLPPLDNKSYETYHLYNSYTSNEVIYGAPSSQ